MEEHNKEDVVDGTNEKVCSSGFDPVRMKY